MRQNTIHTRLRAATGAALLAAGLLGGCVKHDVEVRPTPAPAPTNGYAEIALDWGDAAEHPATVRYLFYDEGGALVKEVTGLSDGFRDALPVGKYRLVVHNEDARQVDYRGTETYATAEVFAQETQYTYGLANTAPRNAVTRHDPGVPCIFEPQSVYGTGCCKEFEVLDIQAGETARGTVTPERLTREVAFRFVVMSDVGIQSLKGVLGGIAPGIFIATARHTTSSSCAMEFTASPVAKSAGNEFAARLNVFNLLTAPDSPNGTNPLDVNLNLADGRMFTAQVDLTPTLKQIIEDSGGVIPIEIPVEVTFTIVGVDLTLSVTPWDGSGTGGGDFE